MKRTTLRRAIAPAATVAALALTLAACGGDNEDTDGGDTASGLSGTITIDGSSTVGPMTAVAAELFNEDNPDVRDHRRRVRHRWRLREVLRRRDRHEQRLPSRSRTRRGPRSAKRTASTFQEMVVANDALTVDRPHRATTWATCLTVEQLKTIWEPKADDKITNWNQVDPSFPDEELDALRPWNRLRHVRLLHRRDQR